MLGGGNGSFVADRPPAIDIWRDVRHRAARPDRPANAVSVVAFVALQDPAIRHVFKERLGGGAVGDLAASHQEGGRATSFVRQGMDLGGAPAVSEVAAERSAKSSTLQPVPPHDACPASLPYAIACMPRAKRKTPKSIHIAVARQLLFIVNADVASRNAAQGLRGRCSCHPAGRLRPPAYRWCKDQSFTNIATGPPRGAARPGQRNPGPRQGVRPSVACATGAGVVRRESSSFDRSPPGLVARPFCRCLMPEPHSCRPIWNWTVA